MKYLWCVLFLSANIQLATAQSSGGLKGFKPGAIKRCSAKEQWDSKYKMCIPKYHSGCNSSAGPYTLSTTTSCTSGYECIYDDGTTAFNFCVQ